MQQTAIGCPNTVNHMCTLTVLGRHPKLCRLLHNSKAKKVALQSNMAAGPTLFSCVYYIWESRNLTIWLSQTFNQQFHSLSNCNFWSCAYFDQGYLIDPCLPPLLYFCQLLCWKQPLKNIIKALFNPMFNCLSPLTGLPNPLIPVGTLCDWWHVHRPGEVIASAFPSDTLWPQNTTHNFAFP